MTVRETVAMETLAAAATARMSGGLGDDLRAALRGTGESCLGNQRESERTVIARA